MTIQSSKTPVNRKELKRPDAFTTSTTSVFNELSKHQRALVGVMVAALVAGLIVMWFSGQQKDKSEAAQNALFLADQAVQKKLTSMAPPPPAAPAKPEANKKAQPKTPAALTPEDLAFQKMDVDQVFGDAVAQYKAVTEKYSGTQSAFEARTALGNLYIRHGQPDKAVSWFQAAAESAPGPAPKSYAWSSLGYALENSGKTADALKAYEKALNLGESTLKGDLLLSIARCQEALNEKAKARSTYDQVLAQLPNTDYAKSAQIFKSRIQ